MPPLDKQRPSAAEKLELFLVEMLMDTHDMYAGQPKVNEIVGYISPERLDRIMEHKDINTGYIAGILREGEEAGEFEAEDVDSAAEYIYRASVVASYPAFMNFYPLPELERNVRGIVRLIIKGIGKR